MQLTEHFSEEELGVHGCDKRLVENALYLSTQVLEPIRAKCGVVYVHDGYRDPGHNARVGGKTDSFHLYEGGCTAVDVSTPGMPLGTLFFWLRMESALPFDKIIIEHEESGQAKCIHIQVDRLNAPRRLAYIGSTGASASYTEVEVK